eukprot:CAMPEP_0115636034 /NCGR_PEP_ID=MMETSP0272-20121206/33450_1 /TAXON_ID=71861 /ORGANISM="Scrippsiella trochoidea, Strain CCMP3099" /LENGTH=51 /DNA_ID=CAMNT_0003073005 /DNA_START=102 /DNA_END=253 /DNA_ORIENTATION=-
MRMRLDGPSAETGGSGGTGETSSGQASGTAANSAGFMLLGLNIFPEPSSMR